MCYYPTRCRFHRAASPSGKNALPHCTAGHKLAAVASPRYHTDCRDVAEVPPYYYYYYYYDYYDYYDPT